jgi:hypothetical protein
MANTPTFTFRLPDEERKQLVAMSKLYGSPNPRAFLREMIGSMVSGDQERATAFNTRLVEKMTGQMALALQHEAQTACTDSEKADCIQVTKKRRLRRKSKVRRKIKVRRV